METYSIKYKIRLGIFVAGGLTLFALGIFVIGNQRNMFNPVFRVSSMFYNVSGLQVGNNVRFSGINIGTVDNIDIINDSTVLVEMIIQQEVSSFIKNDSKVLIGSEGIIGDRLLNITQGSPGADVIKQGQFISSEEPVETDAIIASFHATALNAEIISNQLAMIVYDINNGSGTLSRLIQDSVMAENLNQTMIHLKQSSKGLDENMEAAKQSVLLRGYYKRKEKQAEKETEKKAGGDQSQPKEPATK